MKPLVAAGTAGAASLALVAGLWLAAGRSDDSPAAEQTPTGPVVQTSLGLPTPTGDPESRRHPGPHARPAHGRPAHRSLRRPVHRPGRALRRHRVARPADDHQRRERDPRPAGAGRLLRREGRLPR
ncbi:hypothetical protein G5V59_15570 [Nocardioides sp. W3-2-3]|uniref:hypothetical protein n=1 Tax=Nocardioides convexus TaxID=2712224 RepID=UPI0024189D33|nr:hypothetical protein [Nocardioides convexus]NHA00859.1 hypothetical protein [Nocardioides convexus]